ncbi:ATP-binding protein [Bacillus sp. SD088]|uniref:ATP-binding protein n=1 Tax=Bacillus sp. SD088 TaxID=2782012 RepID=UPI001F614A83|nr:ATP-binding protein [Bacillus sp. SD088]
MMTEELEKRGVSIATNIASSSSDYILTDDQYSIHLLLNQAKQTDEDVRYILVIDKQNNVVGHTFSDYLPKGILDAHTSSGISNGLATITSNEGKIHDVLVPVEEGDVGYVRVGMTEERVRSYLYNKVGQLIFITMIVCAVAASIAYYLTNIITKPIDNLVDTATGISSGNLKLRATSMNNDEIGKLAHTFNNMADNLINSRNKINKLLIELQEKNALRDTLIQKLLSAQEDERKRISRELHDETSQALTSLMITMRVLANEAQNEEQKKLLNTCRDTTANILTDIRDIAVELRPPIIDDIGIFSAINKYIDDFYEKYLIEVEFDDFKLDSNLIDNQISLALYRIIQESLTNIVKHSTASRVTIKIWLADNHVNLKIRDNGQGITKEDIRKAHQQKRIGIYGMQERAELLGGSCILKPITGGGTEVLVCIPLVYEGGEWDEANN